MPTKTPKTRTRTPVTLYRVACRNYTQSRPSEETARTWIANVEKTGLCRDWHTIEVRVDNGEWTALHLHRAALILAAPVGPTPIDTPDGPLIKQHGGWSAKTAAKADAAAPAGTPEWLTALGPHEHATLTADGRGARTDTWCACDPQPAAGEWIRYERYTAEGRDAHGLLCDTCRGLTQSG